MDQQTGGPGGEGPVLYKCPYCVSGRFTAKDGWNAAVQHIKQQHTEKRNSSSRRSRRARSDVAADWPASRHSLFDEDPT